MPRGPRLDYPLALHHVIARGIERRAIFRSDFDRQDFLDRLAAVVADTGLCVYAWCLMPNHVHLLARTGATPLSRPMHRLLGGYASSFNRRRRRCGYLFQNRFKSILVQDDPYFLELVRYIHSNPLRAGLLADIRDLDRHPWTGHAALLGRQQRPWQSWEFVLSQFGSSVRSARRAYRRFVCEGLQRGAPRDLSGGGLRRSAGGWQVLAALRRGRERWVSDERILGDGDFVERVLAQLERPACPRVGPDSPAAMRRRLQQVAARERVPAVLIASACKRPDVVRGRAIFCLEAHEEGGWAARRLAAYLNVSLASVHRALRVGREACNVSRDPSRQNR